MELFKEFGAASEKMFQVMDDRGRIIAPEWKPDLPDERVLDAFKRMLYVRTADQMAVSYQRQGRMYTYPPNFGQEAVGVAVGLNMREEDWLVTAYRELGAWLAKGATMKDVFLYFCGNEEGSTFPGATNMLPFSVPIGSQALHAAGVGYALKYQRKPGVVFVFFGDGATSEGDFHEGLNFAAVWKAPVVFVCQNNQYAISCPRSKQTASRTLAVKAVAYGMEGVQVDGNDLFATYAAVSAAKGHAAAGLGPVLVEAVTYRRGAHTTSDDPGRYRTSDEEKGWEQRDPVDRLRSYLVERSLWSGSQEAEIVEQFKRDVDAQFQEAEKRPAYELENVFRFHYKEMPDELKRQLVGAQKFENWKESHR